MAKFGRRDSVFSSDKESSQRASKQYLEFILANKNKLLNIANGRKYLMSAEELAAQKEAFTDNQKSYIDVIYEKTMKSLNLPYFTVTYKPKRGI